MWDTWQRTGSQQRSPLRVRLNWPRQACLSATDRAISTGPARPLLRAVAERAVVALSVAAKQAQWPYASGRTTRRVALSSPVVQRPLTRWLDDEAGQPAPPLAPPTPVSSSTTRTLRFTSNRSRNTSRVRRFSRCTSSATAAKAGGDMGASQRSRHSQGSAVSASHVSRAGAVRRARARAGGATMSALDAAYRALTRVRRPSRTQCTTWGEPASAASGPGCSHPVASGFHCAEQRDERGVRHHGRPGGRAGACLHPSALASLPGHGPTASAPAGDTDASCTTLVQA